MRKGRFFVGVALVGVDEALNALFSLLSLLLLSGIETFSRRGGSGGGGRLAPATTGEMGTRLAEGERGNAGFAPPLIRG